MEPISIYIHIPFCQHRCAYCDFNTYINMSSIYDDYVLALCSEISIITSQLSEKLTAKTIYFGGGTPTLLSFQQYQRVFNSLYDHFLIPSDIEITIEANPGTVKEEYLKRLRELGINRISFGVQSAINRELQILERQHNYFDVINCIKWARKADFENINLDLIYGLPDQTIEDWKRSLALVIGLHPQHISLYNLSIEKGTPFGKWLSKGLLSIPNPDIAADMYEWASEFLGEDGFLQYEISNWGKRISKKKDRNEKPVECKHNLQYWLNLNYFGFGAGAHSYFANNRSVNYLSPTKYIKALLTNPQVDKNLDYPSSPVTEFIELIDRKTEIGETMMMGLRLTERGVSKRSFQKRFNQSIEEIFGNKIDFFIQMSLLEWGGQNREVLRLTKKGRLLGNQVFAEFLL
jgi:oxygen-independent coproporphyrinogen III oxidase